MDCIWVGKSNKKSPVDAIKVMPKTRYNPIRTEPRQDMRLIMCTHKKKNPKNKSILFDSILLIFKNIILRTLEKFQKNKYNMKNAKKIRVKLNNRKNR